MTTRRMSQQIHHQNNEKQATLVNEVVKNEGDFENFPEITPKTRETLKARGINFLFPVQTGSFR